jgi:hypothetical protein
LALLLAFSRIPQKLRLANFPPLAYFVPNNSVSEDVSQADLDCSLVSDETQGESFMKQRSVYLAAVLIVGLAFIGVSFAQRPETNIDPSKHPNLAEAQHHILEAFEKIDEAQRANKDQLGSHAEKAKQLLDQASRELKEAAEFANHHK